MASRCPTCGGEVEREDGLCSRCSPGLSLAATVGEAHEAEARARMESGSVFASRFKIIDRLGSGAMGEVYRAEDEKLGQAVALKFLPAQLAGDPRWMARVREEVKLARRVSHPNVCRVHDIGESERGPFISMEHIEGEDLASLLRRVGRLPQEKVMELARQICAGLAAAHGAGVLHRDLKPANVMLDSEGVAHITDFGIAIGRADVNRAVEVAGTPAYMAPEQLAGKEASEQTDIYAFGVLLYELLTGRRPFIASSLNDLRRQQQEGPVATPSSVVSGVDPGLDTIVERCTAADAGKRPSSALAVLTALSGGNELQAALSAGQTPSPDAVANTPTAGTLRPAVAWACFAAILICLAFVAVFGPKVSVVERSSLELPPDALMARARQIVKDLGYSDWGQIAAWNFAYEDTAMQMPVDRSRHPRLTPVMFWYRQGSRPLLSGWKMNRISALEPTPETGDLALVLDPAGRLWEFVAVPEQPTLAGDQTKVKEDSVTRLFQLAEFDIARFQRTPVTLPPPVYADSVSSWQLTETQPGAEGATIRAGFLQGRPVYFKVMTAWEDERSQAKGPSGITAGLFICALLSVLIAAALLAWRNVRTGRGDRRIAFRIAFCVLLLDLLYWFAGAHHTTALQAELNLLLLALSWAVFEAASAGLYYLALEPYVRRHWPESLVSWNRLFMGRFADPMVARDVLLGVLATWFMGSLATVILVFLESGAFPVGRQLDPLLGTRFVIAGVAGALTDAIYNGQMFLMILLLARAITGRRRMGSWIFLAALSALMFSWLASLPGPFLKLGIVPVLLSVITWFFILTRLGLLGVVSCTFLIMLGMHFPDTMRLTGWYAFVSWSVMAPTLVLAAFGLYFSVGKTPLIRLPAM